jgi:hypothetical protein
VSTAKVAHKFGPNTSSSKASGHPIMYGKPKVALDFGPFPDGGGYPHAFLEWAYATMEADPDSVVHFCSGSMTRGIRIDIRPEMNPTYCCDCRKTPLADGSVKWIMADPPYSKEYAHNLYGTSDVYPKPYEIVKEATRILEPGGMLGLLHFQVPYFRKPMKLVGVWAITQGLGYNIRAWTLLRKQGETPKEGT